MSVIDKPSLGKFLRTMPEYAALEATGGFGELMSGWKAAQTCKKTPISVSGGGKVFPVPHLVMVCV